MKHKNFKCYTIKYRAKHQNNTAETLHRLKTGLYGLSSATNTDFLVVLNIFDALESTENQPCFEWQFSVRIYECVTKFSVRYY